MRLSKAAVAREMGEWNARIQTRLTEHKRRYILQGTLFILAGAMAAAMPGRTVFELELIIGAILTVIGVFQFIITLRSKMHWWSLLSAFLSIGIGLFVLCKPVVVLGFFVTLLALFLTVEGLLELLLALEFRPVAQWRWMLFSALITLAMALVLWIGFPVFDVLYLGWMIAVNLILYGVSLLMLVWRVAS